jgi:hypothetical protein
MDWESKQDKCIFCNKVLLFIEYVTHTIVQNVVKLVYKLINHPIFLITIVVTSMIDHRCGIIYI